MFFKLSNSIDTKKVGVINQSSRLTGKVSGGLSVAIHSYINELKGNENFPEDIPILEEILLEEEAKVTDYIQVTYLPPTMGIVISERLKKEVEQLAITNYKFYEAVVTHKKREYPYYFLFLKDSGAVIDYPQSLFNVMDVFEEKILETKVFRNKEEQALYAQKIVMEGLQLIVPAEIKLTKYLDIVRVPYTGRIHISENLKNIIEKNKFSGMEVKAVMTRYNI
jgi:hypothetical protein